METNALLARRDKNTLNKLTARLERMEVGRLHRALIDMQTSPCSRCTWGHTPASTGSPASSCGGVLFRGRRAGSSPLAPCFDALSSFFFFYSRSEQKHKSPLISWRFSRGKGGDVSRIPEFISSAWMVSTKPDCCCSNRNREDRKRQVGSMKKN